MHQKLCSADVQLGESLIAEEVTQVTSLFNELLSRTNRVSDKLSSVVNKSKV